MPKSPNQKRAHESSEYAPEHLVELARCSKDPIYFMKHYVKVKHPKKGWVPLELYHYQERMVDALLNHRDVIMLCSRQMGKTTIAAMYLLWMTCFQEKKEVIIASKNMSHATQIMARIKDAYDELPHWLKPGAKYDSRTMLEFDNGSKIVSEATTSKTGRGSSPAAVMLDELAFAAKNIQDEMWASLTASLSTGGQLIVTSTPNGDTDLFAELWHGATAPEPRNNFFPVTAYWHEHPDRGQEYYDDMVKKLGPVKAGQELDCVFLSSDALLISTQRLNKFVPEEPKFEDMGFKFWTDKIGGRGKTYLVGVDPATGNGADYTAIEVFEFPSLQQVAELRMNTVSIPLIYAKIKWLLKKLRQPDLGRGRAEIIWSFERNGVGEALVAMIQNDESPDAAWSLDGCELFNEQNGRFGCYTTGKSKLVSCMQMKNLVERATGGLQIKSKTLIYELKQFVAQGGSYAAKAGETDDLVMALCVVMKLLNRLSSYDDQARSMVYEMVQPSLDLDDPNVDTFGNDPVPIAFG